MTEPTVKIEQKISVLIHGVDREFLEVCQKSLSSRFVFNLAGSAENIEKLVEKHSCGILVSSLSSFRSIFQKTGERFAHLIHVCIIDTSDIGILTEAVNLAVRDLIKLPFRNYEIKDVLNQARIKFMRERNILSQIKTLQMSQNSFHQIVDCSSSAILVLDSRDRVRFINPATERMFRRKKDEILGKTLHFSVSPGEQMEMQVVRKNGTFGVAQMICQESVWNNQKSTLILLNEVTELKEAEARAVSASQAKSNLLANMSHEIRTPLNSILGMTDILIENLKKKENIKYAEIISKAGNSLYGLINDILDLSKIEAGQIEFEEVHFNLYSFVKESVELMLVKARSKGIELSYSVEPGLNCDFSGDPTRIRQILVNLLSNAVKFTDQGSVTLEVVVGKSRAYHDKSKTSVIVFKVKDTGVGLSQDQQGKIFDSYTQADKSVTRKYGGTGLGLAISKNLAELMKGTILLRSKPGFGSTFTFKIPLIKLNSPVKAIEFRPDFQEQHSVLVNLSKFESKKLKSMLEEFHSKVSCIDSPLKMESYFRSRGSYSGVVVCLAQDLKVHRSVFDSLIAYKKIIKERIICLNDLSAPIRFRDYQNQMLDLPVCRVEFEQKLRKIKNIKSGESTKTKVKKLPGASYNELKILLADDMPDNRFLIESFLKNYPFRLDYAENGDEAFSKFIQGNYDMVLMDIQMPVMDGHTATKKIRDWEKKHKTIPVPVIALIAHAMKKDHLRSLDAGCSDHLTKPLRKQELLDAIIPKPVKL